MAILDHSLPLQVKAPDMMGMLDQGSQIAQFYTQNKTDGELNRLYKEANGDLNKMMEIGKTSPMARFVMPQLQAQQAAKDKAALDAQKTQADIAKTQSETLGNNDKVAQSRLSAMYKAIGHAAMTGDKNAAIYAANAAQSAGAITPEQYTESIGILNSMDSVEKIKQYATSVQQMLSQDPAKFNSTTADNRLDNETSRFNNEATVGATLAGQQVQKEIANDKLEFDKGKISPLYTEGQAALKNGAKFETIGGVTYIDLGNGKGIPYVDQDGKPLSATSKANGVPKLSDNALKQVNEASTQLSQARQSYTKIGGLVNDLKSGKLDLSASNIVAAKGRMALGLSTPNDLAIDRFQAALNQAANDVLMMAKGTQTEGDAQRAVATITANPPRDNNAAMQALNTLAGIQRNTINTLNGSINTIYDNYGIARPGINKPSQNGGGSPANNTGGRPSLSSILFE
ncbi:hypothetical protein ABTP01_16465 [Acinetobacter baumannii]